MPATQASRSAVRRRSTPPQGSSRGQVNNYPYNPFPRHDKVNGKRFQEPVDVEVPLHIKTGRKLSEAA